jgi:predicted GNAT family acetyltransferase
VPESDEDDPGGSPRNEDDVGTEDTAGTTGTRVVDNDQARRYELWVGDDRVGFAAYRRETGRVVFTHTVIDPAHEGHGYGSTLARAVLEDAVSRGETIVPRCPFIRAWLEKHPDAFPSADIDWPDQP